MHHDSIRTNAINGLYNASIMMVRKLHAFGKETTLIPSLRAETCAVPGGPWGSEAETYGGRICTDR